MYCDIQTPLERYLAFMIIGSFILSVFVALLIRIFVTFNIILIFVAAFFIIQATIYAYLMLTADSRAKFVEELLPDALQLMSANLRAGMTVDKALLLAARPEFGQFQEDINRVGKEIATGKEFEVALMDLGQRIRSEKLRKTFQLIVSGVQSGGQIADLLEQTASNLRQKKLIDQRIRSSVLTYVIFIFAAIGFGAPMLFGLSSFLIEVITDIFGKIQLPPASVTAQIPITFTKVTISPNFVNTYVITAMISTSILGSLIMGLIGQGNEKEGLKYIPILIVLTISLFFIVKFVIGSMLGGLFNI